MRSCLLIAVMLLAVPVMAPAASGADVRMSFTVSDGDSMFYTADLENASMPGRLVIAYDILNNTLYVKEVNVANITIYLGGVFADLTEIMAQGVARYLDAIGSLKIEFVGNGTNRYAIVGVPEVFSAYLDGEVWSDYKYSNGTVRFTLDMSEHDVELMFDPEDELSLLFVFIIAMVFIGAVGIAAIVNGRLNQK